jgi:hypothetical protein
LIKTDVATVLGVSQIINSIAGALGSSLAGTIWNQLLPPLIEAYSPTTNTTNIQSIMGSTDIILALPEAEYLGVVQAFSDVQRLLSIVSLCLGCLGMIAALFMKPIELGETVYHGEYHHTAFFILLDRSIAKRSELWFSKFM